MVDALMHDNYIEEALGIVLDAPEVFRYSLTYIILEDIKRGECFYSDGKFHYVSPQGVADARNNIQSKCISDAIWENMSSSGEISLEKGNEIAEKWIRENSPIFRDWWNSASVLEEEHAIA